MNIRHHVTQIAQVNQSSCWHACLQMVYGRRNVRPLGNAVFANYLTANGRLNDSDTNIQAFATRFGFVKYPHQVYTIERLHTFLRTSPVMVLGNWAYGLHAYVISGITGNGTPNGTELYLNNPAYSHPDHFQYSFFIAEFQRGAFGILKPRRWSGS